jgi:Ser/Thr protein kinase RdoA (MazF antagonist)
LPQGSTHGDLFNDNLVRADDGWHVIDWEYAARDSLVLDVAIALVGVCRTGTTLPASGVERFLAGYE